MRFSKSAGSLLRFSLSAPIHTGPRLSSTKYNLYATSTSLSNKSSQLGQNQLVRLRQISVFRAPVLSSHQYRELSISVVRYNGSPDEPSSKVEETVKNLKQQLEEKDKTVSVPTPKRSIWKRIEDEILHYYHGFRLLYLDTKICIALIWRILNGKNLTRREHRQLIRTSSDLFRLVPFSVFIIVPFMELLLPIFLKFFPGMLPSTFQTKNERDAKMKAQLKVKLEMAKFLQQTLDEMTLESKGHSSEKAKEFAQFFQKIRKSGEEVSTSEIIEFSKLFEDEITLDSLTRQQLRAICRVLEIPPIGNNTLLRFQLKMKLRALKSDDKTIESEGVESLNVSELQMACKSRGMRAVGVDEDRMRRQLSQWLQLSLHEKVPPSLLLLSRALYLPEDLPTTAQLQATLQALPDSAAIQTKAAIGELEGKVDHKTRLEVIKEEERKIREERKEAREAAKSTQPAKTIDKIELVTDDKETQIVAHETPSISLITQKDTSRVPKVDKVVVEEVEKEVIVEEIPLSTELHLRSYVANVVEERLSRHIEHPMAELDKGTLIDEDELERLDPERKEFVNEKEELEELKEELAEYEEDIKDLQVLKTGEKSIDVKETKGAQRLYKKVNKMVSRIDKIVKDLPAEDEFIKSEPISPPISKPIEKNEKLP